MRKTTLFILLAFVALYFDCHAQTATVNDLKIKIKSAKNTTEKLALLQTLCRNSSSMPADTLNLYATRALQLALHQTDDTKIWEAKYMYAFSLRQRSLVDSSLLISNQLVKEIKHLDKNFAIYHEALGMKAICLKIQNNIKEATATVYQMLASAEKYKDISGQINAYNLLTIVGGRLTGFDDANANDVYLQQCIVWYRKAISLFKDTSYYKKYDKILLNLGITYYQLPKSKYDSALRYVNLAYFYARKQNQLRIMASCSNVIGTIFLVQQKLDSAEYYLKQEAAIDKQIGDPERIALSFAALRSVYHQQKNYKKALEYDLIEKNYSVKNHLAMEPSLYVNLAQDYKDLGNFKAQSEVLNTMISLKDSIFQANSAADLAEIRTKYEVQKKENTIIQQEYSITRKRYLIYGISGLLLLLLITGLMILRNRRQRHRHRIKEMLMEYERRTQQAVDIAKEEERTRIIADLHDDVGGGLSTIRMVSDLIAEQQEQTQQLNQYALKISNITKDVTQRMNTIVWALNADNNTGQNLVEYIREYGIAFFEDSPINFRCDLPDAANNILLSGLQRKNIFLSVKEALNNVYKHSGAKNTWVEVRFIDGLLTVAIHDDGKGIRNENSSGNGLKNINSRMAEINGKAIFEKGIGASVFLRLNI